MATRKKQGGSQGGKVGCLFVLLAFCIGLLVVLANLGKIRATLERTNFTEIMKTQRDAEPGAKQPTPVTPAPKVKDDPAAVGPSVDPKAAGGASGAAQGGSGTPAATAKGGSQPESATPGKDNPQAAAGGTETGVTDKSGQKTPAGPAAKGGGSTSPATSPATTAAKKTRAALLYFVHIDEDGIIARQEVTRQIPASDQPLTDALAALLSGPTETELRKSLVSLIPQGTKLLSVQVRGSTAVLNFNEAFMYNHYGIEGYAGQLKQVVYTATAFSSVQDVQILIEGERHDYLGGEGVYIGKPLSRNSF